MCSVACTPYILLFNHFNVFSLHYWKPSEYHLYYGMDVNRPLKYPDQLKASLSGAFSVNHELFLLSVHDRKNRYLLF